MANGLSAKSRPELLKSLASETFDFVIIGGGINGAGVARDAASRGMKVALIEARDFASGTSSRSSKLIHGGIRYLENLEFGLVFEALQERRHLFEIAPHLVHPLRFILPIYKNSRVGMFKLGLGMILYDLLATFEMPELHEKLNKNLLLSRVPILNGNGLCGGYAYSDAYMDDDRLVIETLRSAVRMGASVVSYVKAIGANFDDDQRMSRLIARDEESGLEVVIKAKHFISTVGPWTDLVATQMLKNWRPILRPSKGVHLTFLRTRLPIHDAIVMISDDEKRIVFAIPRHEMVIVGTTDTDYAGDPVDVRTTRDDVEYLLHVANRYFSHAKLTEADIVASYSGVRPLVDDQAATESKTSREQRILSDPRNITFVAGGKYTTYRKVAESVVETALNELSLEDQVRYSRNQTLKPLNPLASRTAMARARHFASSWASELGIHPSLMHVLVERHGEEARDIVERYGARTAGVHRLWQLEAEHAIHSTMCFHLRDFVLRRSPLFLSRPDHGFLFLDDIAQLFQKELGWSNEQRLNETEAVRQHVEYEMGWAR